MILSLEIPPYFKCVATLPCEMSQHFIDHAISHWRRQLSASSSSKVDMVNI